MKTFLRGLRAAISRISRLAETLSEIALVGLLLLVAHEVLARYAFDRPTIFSVELSEYILVFLALMPAAWVQHEDRHVHMTLFVKVLPKRFRLGLDVVTAGLVAAFCAILVWKGTQSVIIAYTGDYHSSSLLHFPLWIPYAFVPAAALVLGLQYLVKIGDTIRSLTAPPTNP